MNKLVIASLFILATGTVVQADSLTLGVDGGFAVTPNGYERGAGLGLRAGWRASDSFELQGRAGFGYKTRALEFHGDVELRAHLSGFWQYSYGIVGASRIVSESADTWSQNPVPMLWGSRFTTDYALILGGGVRIPAGRVFDHRFEIIGEFTPRLIYKQARGCAHCLMPQAQVVAPTERYWTRDLAFSIGVVFTL